MAYPAYIREKARELRIEKKLTIDELADRLAISRTTVYYWVRDLPIGQTEKQTLAAYRAGQVTRRIHRARRAAAYEQGCAEYATLLQEPTFRDFVCMYIGEGYKRNRNVVSICNSDPAVIRLGTIWIDRLARNPLMFSFQHHADQDPDELCAFWGGSTWYRSFHD
jgi:excisionase family DNA binding protein